MNLNADHWRNVISVTYFRNFRNSRILLKRSYFVMAFAEHIASWWRVFEILSWRALCP